MTQSGDQLLSAVLALPESERFEIAEAILASLNNYGDSPLDESWRAEILRRSAEIDSGKVQPLTWENVKHDLWERTGG